ncbi:MAG TPA: polysaccharide biosynthesis/export family protein [Cyclobacteriaceae bacterium]|nr:polysaccharide biosynthesis/export family protein [Cyclobacteriaceae bacterium]
MLKKIFVSLLLVCVTLIALAQSLNDIQKIKVDQLSDAQIEELVKRAEASGMNEQQLEAMAAQRGMPAAEIAKLRTRINALRRGRVGMTDENQRRMQGRQLNEIMGEDIFLSITWRERDTIPKLTEEQKKIFGYTLFHNKTLDFSPNFNMATPKSYVIGPGDELIIEVYGTSQQSYNLMVSPEGTINIPNLGIISVAGLSMDAATSRLINRLSTIYAT